MLSRLIVCVIACLSAPLYASRSEGYRLFIGAHYASAYETHFIPGLEDEDEMGFIIGGTQEMDFFGPFRFETGLIHFSRHFAVSAGLVPDIITAPYAEVPISLRIHGENLSVGGGLSLAYGYGRFQRVVSTSDGSHGSSYIDYSETAISRFETSILMDARLTFDFMFNDVFLGIRYRRNLASPSSGGDNSAIRMSHTPLFTDLELLVGKTL